MLRTDASATLGRTRRSSVRSRVRVQWLVLAAALVAIAATVVAWALSEAADRVPVVAVRGEVRAGDVIDANDLTTVGIAFDAQVRGLVSAANAAELVGSRAAIDLHAGQLVVAGMWTDDPQLAADERSVGIVVDPGRFPSGIVVGDVLEVVSVTDVAVVGTVAASGVPTPPTGAEAPTVPSTVRVLDVGIDDAGRLQATLAVDEFTAPAVARLAASAELALLGTSIDVEGSPAGTETDTDIVAEPALESAAEVEP